MKPASELVNWCTRAQGAGETWIQLAASGQKVARPGHLEKGD